MSRGHTLQSKYDKLRAAFKIIQIHFKPITEMAP